MAEAVPAQVDNCLNHFTDLMQVNETYRGGAPLRRWCRPAPFGVHRTRAMVPVARHVSRSLLYATL